MAGRYSNSQSWKVILGAYIGYVECPMLTHPVNLWRIRTDLLSAYGDGTKMSPLQRGVSFVETEYYIINPTHPRRAFDNGIKHRLDIGRRTTNDAEHLAGCRL